MADPNSLITRFRIIIADLINPYPDVGEAWCVGCSINEDRTIVLSVEGIQKHVEDHVSRGGSSRYVHIFGCRTEEESDAVPPGV